MVRLKLLEGARVSRSVSECHNCCGGPGWSQWGCGGATRLNRWKDCAEAPRTFLGGKVPSVSFGVSELLWWAWLATMGLRWHDKDTLLEG